MITLLRCYILLLAVSLSFGALADNPKVRLNTDLGDIIIELYPDEAPDTVENFLQYVKEDFYNGTIFHRVIKGFMAQTGGMTFDFTLKQTREPVDNEADNGLKNIPGTVAMARKPDPDSATSQFFINLNYNTHLDPADDNAGYTVFGRVTEGMNVVERIADEPQGLYRRFPNAPNQPIRILKAEIIKQG